jgi:hypothetical protein
MIRFEAEEGLSIVQVDTATKQSKLIALTEADLDAIMVIWPQFRAFLSTADAPNVAPATHSRPAYKASSEQGSLLSSPPQSGLL